MVAPGQVDDQRDAAPNDLADRETVPPCEERRVNAGDAAEGIVLVTVHAGLVLHQARLEPVEKRRQARQRRLVFRRGADDGEGHAVALRLAHPVLPGDVEEPESPIVSDEGVRPVALVRVEIDNSHTSDTVTVEHRKACSDQEVERAEPRSTIAPRVVCARHRMEHDPVGQRQPAGEDVARPDSRHGLGKLRRPGKPLAFGQ
jgi:hypothetical protein